MSRLTTKVEICGKEVTVQELAVGDVWDQAAKVDAESRDIKDLVAIIQDLWPKVCPGLALEELKGAFPSEIKELVRKIKEVNADFFEVPREMGLGAMLDGIKDTISIELNAQLVALFRPVMESETSGSMDGDTSSGASG